MGKSPPPPSSTTSPPSLSDSQRSHLLPQPQGRAQHHRQQQSGCSAEEVAADPQAPSLKQLKLCPSCPSESMPAGTSGLSQAVYEPAVATTSGPTTTLWECLPHFAAPSLDINVVPCHTTSLPPAVAPTHTFDDSVSLHSDLPLISTPSAVLPVLHVRSPSTAVNAELCYFSSREPATQSIPINLPPHPLRPTLSTMSIHSQYSVSPGSAISSPALAAMTDITPLPSPIISDGPPATWKKGHARPGSSSSLSSLREHAQVDDFAATTGASAASSCASSIKKKKKLYPNLMPAAVEAGSHKSQARVYESGHSRHRSVSEYAAEPMHNVRPRNITLSLATAPNGKLAELHLDNPLHREKHLAGQRGFIHHGPESHPAASFPTPPPSNRSVTESEGDEVMRDDEAVLDHATMLRLRDEISGRKLQYREVKPLGQGTFSKVVLGTRESIPANFPLDDKSEQYLDPRRLAAVKIVEHGPAGGADEERMELSLRREIEIMRSISHPCLIHLMAYGINEEDSLMILRYCPGGDLFELASEGQDLLTPALVQRIFAELVSAVQYLHSKNIVHRDLKLENVLVNLRREELAKINDPATYPRSLITVTDLGLSRHVDPETPLLQTRCGSEDYAAPEILLSQSYDGRLTDAWALGVLLYALMEARLPFDAPPPKPGSKIRSRGRAAHRIARCEWIWSRFGDAYGEWDDEAGKGWEGPRAVVEGLLKKVNKGRMTLEEVASHPWVKSGIRVPGGLKTGDDE